MTRGCISNPVGQNKWKKKLFLSFYFSISNRLSTRNYGNERESREKRKQTRRTSPLTNIAVQDSSPWRALIREVSWPVLFADSGRLLYGRKPTGSSPISLSSFFFSNYFFFFFTRRFVTNRDSSVECFWWGIHFLNCREKLDKKKIVGEACFTCHNQLIYTPDESILLLLFLKWVGRRRQVNCWETSFDVDVKETGEGEY